MNVIRRKKRGKGEGEERKRKTEGKKTKKIPKKINSWGKVGSGKGYLSVTEIIKVSVFFTVVNDASIPRL